MNSLDLRELLADKQDPGKKGKASLLERKEACFLEF
jgi:hypothetical protein